MIRIFTTPECPRCLAAKAYLRERGVKFQEINVKGNLAGLREMVRISGVRSVPVIQAGSRTVVGFDRGALERLLGQRGRREE